MLAGNNRGTKIVSTCTYPEELLRHATRLMFESGRLIAHVAPDLGVRLAQERADR
jgi:hypothetical protein